MRSIFFRADGLRFFAVDSSNDTVYQYSLTVAWDVSTATFDSKSKDISSENLVPNGLFFKDDGTVMYVSGISPARINEYDLSTAWDVSTAVSTGDKLDLITEDNSPDDIFFHSDGATLYMLGEQNDSIYQYKNSSTSVRASNDNNITGTALSVLWSEPTVCSDIHSSLETRSFFSSSPSDKLISRGELTFLHANPEMTVTLLTPDGYDNEVEFTNRVYDETKYDIDGHIDYVTSNVNLDHNDEGRKNYMPITMPGSGISNPINGITVNQEVERSEPLFGNITSQRVEVKMVNTQGHVGIKEVVLDSVDKGINKTRSL